MPRSEETAGDRRMRHLFRPRAIARRRPYDLHKWSFGAGPLFSISAGPTPGIRARHPSVRSEPRYPGSVATLLWTGLEVAALALTAVVNMIVMPVHAMLLGHGWEGLASYYAEAGTGPAFALVIHERRIAQPLVVAARVGLSRRDQFCHIHAAPTDRTIC